MNRREHENQSTIIPFRETEDAHHELHNDDEVSTDEQGHDAPPPFFQRKWAKRMLALTLSIMLVVNILSFWPQVFSLNSIKFLRKSQELSKSEVIQHYQQAVVVVNAENRKGTGVNIADHGFIITNQHVVGDARQVGIAFPNGASQTAQVIASDAELDIALLHMEQKGLPTLKLAANADASEGSPVTIIGNPLYFNDIATDGYVLGMLPQSKPPRLMIHAPIYKGNSGSPVVNQEGEIIAIVFATLKIEREGKSESVGLAIPVDQIVKTFPQLLQQK